MTGRWSFMLPVAVSLAGLAQGALAPNGIFSDHMVVQRGMPLPVWGVGDAGVEITVRFAGNDARGTVGDDGRWRVELPPVAAGARGELIIAAGGETVVYADVVSGDVFLCSGQSNMAMRVSGVQDAEREAATADFPDLRMATVRPATGSEPLTECGTTGWQPCTPETVRAFSATAYFFGRHLHRAYGVPVGLINSSVGGTAIESWTPAEELAAIPSGRELRAEWAERIRAYDPDAARRDYEGRLAKWEEAAAAARAAGRKVPRKPAAPTHPELDRNGPSRLYNGMIAPLVPYPVKGFVWYQGERNANDPQSAFDYREELPALIRGWRRVWGNYRLPFLFVQLPNFAGKADDSLALNRESMLLVSRHVPGTAMAVTVDIGEPDNIHPRNKQDVGERLGLLARGAVYGEAPGPAAGPVYRGVSVEGDTMVVRLEGVGEGPAARGGGPLRGFTVCGPDRVFVPAVAQIDGATVRVRAEGVEEPVAVRYGWAADPDCNLVNSAGFPASPFRSDEFAVEGVVAR